MNVEEVLKKDARHIECLNFSSCMQYRKTGSSLVALNVAGISEGKESFTHHFIRLMCGTRDHPDVFPQSIVNSCTVHRLIYALVTHLMLLH